MTTNIINNKLTFTLAALAFSVAVPSFAQKKAAPAKEAAVMKVDADPTASQIKWVGKKVTGQHAGTIALKSGHFEVSGQEVKGGTFEIDMTSIKVTDIKETDSSNAKLVGHLKNDDFFGVDKNPTASIKVTSIKPAAKPEAGKVTHEVTGDLTVKGSTHSVTFPALIVVKDNTVHAKGTVAVDRTKFNVKYGSTKFFDKLGDKAISDEFMIELEVKSKLIAKI